MACPISSFVALDNETFPLFRNLGKGVFADITAKSGMARLSAPMAGYSPNIADFDNDGWKDIFVSRGHVQSLGYASTRSGGAAEYGVPQSGRRTVSGAHGGGRLDGTAARAGTGARQWGT